MRRPDKPIILASDFVGCLSGPSELSRKRPFEPSRPPHRQVSNFPVENTGKERPNSASEEKGYFRGVPASIRKAFKYRGSIGHSEAKKSAEERGWDAPRKCRSTSLSYGAEI